MFGRSIKWIMLICGLLTCATSYVMFAPDAALRSALGVLTTSPMALVVVRHWGALIGLFGLMLIYGAFKESVRRMVLVTASAGKAAFIVLVLLQGQQFLLSEARPGVVIDFITVLLFATYLISSRTRATV
jgi:nucleoside recognition membrane protein YjiH